MATIKSFEDFLDRMQGLLDNAKKQGHIIVPIEDLENTFPELKENDDEKTKRILHSISSKISFHLRDIFTEEEFQCFDAWSNAWLEKQGEHKSTNNQFTPEQASVIDQYIDKFLEQHPVNILELKFKVGDWIVNNISQDIYLIKSINNGYCTLEDIKGNIIYPCLPPCENESHLWTIQDAKDGDVLVHNDCTFIFMGIEDGIVQAIEENMLELTSFGEPDKDNDYQPATKEQRDLLFQKMKEAGYEWDAEKKELKKIEPKTAAWTPMDEQHVENLLAIIEGHGYPEEVAWLNSLEDRVQSKQEWSEEDKTMLQYAIEHFERQKRNCIEGGDRKKEMQEFIDWLKSLRPQSTWKPSDEQMTQLKRHCPDNRPLTSLYEQLKKLREE